MNDSPGSLNCLIVRIEELERRVSVLELGVASPASAGELAQTQLPTAAAGPAKALAGSGSQAGGIFSVLGKSMLGIAGAYVLRAFAESGSLPRMAIASVAILYAMMWLVWAARTPAGAWFASTAYACTSALILAPMLWELTLRFNVMPASVAAATLAVFVCAAFALAWKRNLSPVLWAANVSAAAVATALSIATREMAPFIAVLLLMVLLCELASALHHELGVRPLVALAADAVVWGLIYVYSGPPAARDQYPVLGASALLAPGIALFFIVASIVVFKTTVGGKKITLFETIQTTFAFLLAAATLLYFGPPESTIALGILCLIWSGAGFAAVLTRFDSVADRRNTLVYGAWSTALLLAGSWLCLAQPFQSALLGLAAVAAAYVGRGDRRLVFGLYGVVFLLSGTGWSGLGRFLFDTLAGAPAGPPTAVVFLLSGCAVLCYAVARPRPAESQPGTVPQDWKCQVGPIFFASVAAVAIVALLIEGLLALAALGVRVEAQHLAFIRTFIICLAAVGLAFAGARLRRIELTGIGYAALVLVAVKLVFEDLGHGHLEYTAASIFLFALTLIAVPRVARMRQRA